MRKHSLAIVLFAFTVVAASSLHAQEGGADPPPAQETCGCSAPSTNWSVVVSTNPSSPVGTANNPLIVCQNDPAPSATFIAATAGTTPTSTACYTASGPNWNWTGDVSGTNTAVATTFATTNAGLTSKSGEATATYTFASVGTCPAPSPQSQSNSATFWVLVAAGDSGNWQNVSTPQFTYPVANGTTTYGPGPQKLGQGTKPIGDTPAPGCDHYIDYLEGTVTGGSLSYIVLISGVSPCGLQAQYTPPSYQVGWKVSAGISLPYGLLGAGINVSGTESLTYNMGIPPGGQVPNREWRFEVWQQCEDVAMNATLTRVYYAPDGTPGPSIVQTYSESGTVYYPSPALKLDVKCCGGNYN